MNLCCCGGGAVATVTLAGCSCAVPESLTMTSADETCSNSTFRSCSIAYGPTPDEYDDLDLGMDCFLSVESFPDPVVDGALFRYLFTCGGSNQYNLTRVYADSPYGSPYRDGILWSWTAGTSGNTCAPFRLDDGAGFEGVDATCGVTIHG